MKSLSFENMKSLGFKEKKHDKITKKRDKITSALPRRGHYEEKSYREQDSSALVGLRRRNVIRSRRNVIRSLRRCLVEATSALPRRGHFGVAS